MASPVEKTSPPVSKIEQWIRPQIRALSAYHVAEPEGLIKLDAMENPYTWPPALVDAWLETLRGVGLNRYPDPDAGQLKERLREAFEIPADMGVLLGNGSDELIQMINLSLAVPGRVALAPEPTFSMYRIIAASTGLTFTGVPLDGDFEMDLPAMLAAIETHRPAVIYIAYPNNPSGTLFDASAVRALIEAAPGLVVVDEAYYPYSGYTLMEDLPRYDNLLLLRTLSKVGLAGLRLGLLIGPGSWLEQINKTRLPYNIGILAQVSADFALRNKAVFDDQIRRICSDREHLIGQLRLLEGIEVYSSHANFVLFRVAQGRAAQLYDAIKAEGVLIRCFAAHEGPLADCLRVTVGTPQENEAFVRALRRAL